MAAALLTAIFASLAGIVAAIYLGLTSTSNAMLAQHISIGIFTTMITLLAHSMMMFYFLGKGKAVREAAAEGGLSREYERRIADCAQAGLLDRDAGDARRRSSRRSRAPASTQACCRRACTACSRIPASR